MACWDLPLLEASVRSLMLKNILKLITQSSWVVIFFHVKPHYIGVHLFSWAQDKSQSHGYDSNYKNSSMCLAEWVALFDWFLAFFHGQMWAEGGNVALLFFFFLAFFSVNRMKNYAPVLWGFACLLFLIN